MSKYQVGDKFIIELAQAYHVQPGESKARGEVLIPYVTLFRAKGFSALTFDELGLDKLERYIVEPEPCELKPEQTEPDGWHPYPKETPPPGVPLIVTAVQKDFYGKPEKKLIHPVFWRKSYEFDYWAFYQYGTEDGVIGPGTDYIRVTAWREYPQPYAGGASND